MGDYRIIVKERIDKDVFLRVQAVYNDLHIPSCGRCVDKSEEIIEINYCMEGRYECDVNSQYCFYASPGDLSIGNVGRREAAGSFPTGRFQGVTLFIELEMMRKQNDQIIREMEIDLELLHKMAIQRPRRFYIRGRKEFDTVCRQMISAMTDRSLPLLKLKTLELLMLLSDQELLQYNNMHVCLSQKNVQLAKNVRKIITNDLSSHVTLNELSKELHSSPTAIKNAFKNVYGESIRDFMKSIRLQEAQRLIRETEWSIAEVAEMVGYANPGHFAIAFREKYAVSPGDYKKRVRAKS